MATHIASTLLVFGFAIFGWGGFAAFFAHPPLIALTAVGAVQGIASAFSAGYGHIAAPKGDSRLGPWIPVIGAIGILSAFYPAFTDRLEFWTLDGDAVRWLGVFLYSAGGALQLWPAFIIGPGFGSMASIDPGHTLTTNGIYSVIRHPSHLGMIVGMLGWALAFRSGVGVLLTALLILPIIACIRLEEKLLRKAFGGEYEAYCSRTSRFIPGVF